MGTILYVIFGFIEALVGLRFLFRLLGANPDSLFVSWIYSWSAPLVAPFGGIFGSPAITPGTVAAGVVEWAALVALIVYGIIASIVGGLMYRHREHRGL